ncbi:MAG TPA: J domain-containing protein [Acidobacteriaceae bacterium]|nr:J domain-containing protein [Acidobacteriaceae bacterium]
MSTCICGKPADSFGGLCDRCVALESLGLYSTASEEQIENAYQKMLKVWDPDRFGSDPKLRLGAEEKRKEINAAHDYLVSGAKVQEPQAVPYWRKRAADPEEPLPERPAQVPFVADPDEEEPEEIQRILRRRQKSSAPKILLKIGVVLGTAAVLFIGWFGLDAFMSTNQHTSADWLYMKAQVTRDLVLLHLKSENLPGQSTNAQTAPPSVPAVPTQAQPEAPPPPATSRTESAHLRAPETRVTRTTQPALPYVTAGLTPTEVLTVLGKPDSSLGEKMFYKGSEIDFRDGRVAGWRIDPRTSSIRVKLWPEAAPTPGLTAFNIGSTKNDVIAIQGTPTSLSDNEFGYGSSVVFFQNNLVVGWKEDPGSVRLKVAR